MKKIMFNDRYGLTAAVLQGRKTMTRRIVPTQYVPMIEDGLQGAALIEAQRHGDAFRENEIVAVAQSYESIHDEMIIGDYGNSKYDAFRCAMVANTPGWSNKMFVRANLMPHQIQITDINIERLQDITDEDCLKEGIGKDYAEGSPLYWTSVPHTGISWEEYRKRVNEISRYIEGDPNNYFFDNPQAAFAALINRPGVGRKGLWEENPFVFAYSFKLIR